MRCNEDDPGGNPILSMVVLVLQWPTMRCIHKHSSSPQYGSGHAYIARVLLPNVVGNGRKGKGPGWTIFMLWSPDLNTTKNKAIQPHTTADSLTAGYTDSGLHCVETVTDCRRHQCEVSVHEYDIMPALLMVCVIAICI